MAPYPAEVTTHIHDWDRQWVDAILTNYVMASVSDSAAHNTVKDLDYNSLEPWLLIQCRVRLIAVVTHPTTVHGGIGSAS